MSEKSVILLKDVSSSQAETESVVRAVVSSSTFDDLEENVAGERGEESPVGSPKGPVEECDVCETQAGIEVGVEDEDVDIVGGVDEI